MSENPTISLANNDSENKNFMQQSQYRELSVKDESICHGDTFQNPKDSKEEALTFINNYHKIDDTFPFNTFKQSPHLKTKHYKESVYYGEFHNGKKHGLGIMIYKNSRIYQGEWNNDHKKGYGAQKFPNGCYFKGQYLNGKPSGAGSYSWPNGQCYDGEWLNGFKHGSGMWRGFKGDSYKGEWRFGKPQGYGVHTWPNGDAYEGQFKQCLKHGEGIQKFANGDIYKGHYVNGKPSGYGEYYWANGSFFKGNFINGLRDGKGKWKRAAGPSDSYDGHYKNDKKWGYGQFTWSSGNFYKGQYEADQRNGFGQMYWMNGTYYKGHWTNGIQHGQGQIYVPEVGYKKGIFENNVIIQVWEQKVLTKTQARQVQRRTENSTAGRNKTSFRSRGSSYKKANNTAKNNPNKQRYVTHKQTQSSEKGNANHRWSKEANFFIVRRVKTTKQAAGQQKLFSAKQIFDKQKVSSSMHSDFYKVPQIQNSSTKNQSKDRLLHSSFYLYKLNMRHNLETLKTCKKTETNEQEGHQKPAMLFRGKLGQV